MKKILIGLIITIIFLLIVGTILFKLIGPSRDVTFKQGSAGVQAISKDIQNSQEFVSVCYKNYIQALDVGDDQIPTQRYIDNLNTCFTTRFLDERNLAEEDSILLIDNAVGKKSSYIDSQLVRQNTGLQEYRVTLQNSAIIRTLFVTVMTENGTQKISRVAHVAGS